MNNQNYLCGFVAIIGKTNVGKSTLINKFLNKKISITSSKPQTTLDCIIGIHNNNFHQIIYIDTPGITEKNQFNYRKITNFIMDAEIIIFVLDRINWNYDDEIILNKLINSKKPVILAINKIDMINNKQLLLPHINFLKNKMNFLDIVPISAKNEENLNIITNIIYSNIPKKNHIFSENIITSSSKYFIVSELIREKLMRMLNQELPYSVKVKIQEFTSRNHKSFYIHAIIFVKREGQKKIIIGNQGLKIKTIGIQARQDIEKFFNKAVYLRLWVKVNSQLFE